MEDMIAAIQIAYVLCSGHENADFLNSWLGTYGPQEGKIVVIRRPRKRRCTPRQ